MSRQDVRVRTFTSHGVQDSGRGFKRYILETKHSLRHREQVSSPPPSCPASQGQDRLQGQHLMLYSPPSHWGSAESRTSWEISHMPHWALG